MLPDMLRAFTKGFCYTGLAINVVCGLWAWISYMENDEPCEPRRAGHVPDPGRLGVRALPWGPAGRAVAPPPSPWHGVEQSWLN